MTIKNEIANRKLKRDELNDALRIFRKYLESSSEVKNMIKSILFKTQEYRKNDFSISVNTDIEKEVINVIREIGIHVHFSGYQYVRQAIILAVEDPEVISSITKTIYPTIAKQYDTTPNRVERAIRHSIEVAWSGVKIETIEKFFGNKIDPNKGKPTNSQFIAMIADRLRLKTNAN